VIAGFVTVFQHKTAKLYDIYHRRSQVVMSFPEHGKSPWSKFLTKKGPVLGHLASIFYPICKYSTHGQISMKTPNLKCRLFLKGTWRQVLFPPPPPLLHTLHEYIPLCLFTQGRGEGGRWTSEKGRGALVHKRGRLYLQSIKTLLNTSKTTFRVCCL